MNPRYAETFKQVEDRLDEEITDAAFNFGTEGAVDQELLQMAHTLQWTLISICSGAASSFLRKEVAGNGFESWRRLNKRYQMPTRSRAMGRLGAILKPSFNMNAFEDSLSTWEEEVTKYEKETSTVLAGDLKIAVLLNETKGRLQEHLRLHSGTIKTYGEIREAILNYHRAQEA